MINVKRVSLMLILSFLLLIVGSTVALALTTVSAGQTFYYDPWSPDYGSKRQYFTLSYYGDEWEGTDPFGSSFQAVEKQDFFIYRDDKWVIWPPEVGNGKAKLIKVELQNSSGSTVVTQQNSEWEDGTYRDYMFSTDSIRYTFRRNSMISNEPSGSYRIKATGMHYMPTGSWFPDFWEKSITTSYF